MLRLRSAPGGIVEHGVSAPLNDHGVAPLNGRGVTTLNGCGASTTLSDRSGGRGVNWPLSGAEVAVLIVV